MDFVNEKTEEIAKKLLGKKLLVHHDGMWIGGYIVETEAYLGPIDMACHSYNWKRTPKVESMYQIGGTIYIYMMHSHNMLNIVTKSEGTPEAVLIRALQPTDNQDILLRHRGVDGFDLSNGPGKLTKALGVTRELDGIMVNEGKILIAEQESLIPRNICSSARIGIPNKGEWTDKSLRFFVEGNPYVSRMSKRSMQEVDETWKLI